MEKKMKQQWGIWSAAAVAVVAAVIALWTSPVTIEINTGDGVEVVCASFTDEPRNVGLWPYMNEVQDWVEDGRDGDANLYLTSTLGMFDRCGVARENRQTALQLAAIGGATLLILTRPRSALREV